MYGFTGVKQVKCSYFDEYGLTVCLIKFNSYS